MLVSHPSEGPLEVDDTALVEVVVTEVVVVVVVVAAVEPADVAPTEAEVPPAPPAPPVNVNASPQPGTTTIAALRRPNQATHREAI